MQLFVVWFIRSLMAIYLLIGFYGIYKVIAAIKETNQYLHTNTNVVKI